MTKNSLQHFRAYFRPGRPSISWLGYLHAAVLRQCNPASKLRLPAKGYCTGVAMGGGLQ